MDTILMSLCWIMATVLSLVLASRVLIPNTSSTVQAEGATYTYREKELPKHAVVERGQGKGALRGPWVGETGWGMARWAQEKDVLCPGGAQALE